MLKTEVSRFTMNNARGIHLGQLWVFYTKCLTLHRERPFLALNRAEQVHPPSGFAANVLISRENGIHSYGSYYATENSACSHQERSHIGQLIKEVIAILLQHYTIAFLVQWQPLVAAVIITAAKEEVKKNHSKSKTNKVVFLPKPNQTATVLWLLHVCFNSHMVFKNGDIYRFGRVVNNKKRFVYTCHGFMHR